MIRYRTSVLIPIGNRPIAGKIYTPIFSFFRKRVVIITISDLRTVSNESPGNSKFYRGMLHGQKFRPLVL